MPHGFLPYQFFIGDSSPYSLIMAWLLLTETLLAGPGFFILHSTFFIY